MASARLVLCFEEAAEAPYATDCGIGLNGSWPNSRRCRYPGLRLEFIHRLSFVGGFDFGLFPANRSSSCVQGPFCDFAPGQPSASISSVTDFPLVAFLYRREETRWNQYWWCLYPFQPVMWLAVFATLIFLCVYVLCTQKLVRHESFKVGPLDLWEGLLGKGHNPVQPTPTYLKWATIFWQFTAFFLISMYSAVLVSFLLNSTTKFTFDTPAKLVKQVEKGKNSVIFLRDGRLEQMAREMNVSRLSVYARYNFPDSIADDFMKAFISHPPQVISASKRLLLKRKVLEQKSVVVGRMEELEYLRSCSESLTIDGATPSSRNVCAFQLPNGFPRRRRLNQAILALNRMDMLEKLKAKYKEGYCWRKKGIKRRQYQETRVTIRHFAALATILAVGGVLAVVALGLERFIYKKRHPIPQ